MIIYTDHRKGTAELKSFNSSSKEILRNIDRQDKIDLLTRRWSIRHKWPGLLQRFCFNSKKAWIGSVRVLLCPSRQWPNLEKGTILKRGDNRQQQRFVILKKVTVSLNAVPLRQARTNRWSCFWKRTQRNKFMVAKSTDTVTGSAENWWCKSVARRVHTQINKLSAIDKERYQKQKSF